MIYLNGVNKTTNLNYYCFFIETAERTSMKKNIVLCTLTAMSLLTACTNSSKIDSANTNESVSNLSSDAQTEDIIITIPSNGDMIDYAEEFNALDNGYKVVFKDYSGYFDSSYIDEMGISPEAYFGIDEKICLDVMKGNVLDIIPDYVFYDKAKYESLESKGAFADLYSFMVNDNEVNTTTLSEHILDLHEIDGKLYSLPLFFSISTLAGYSKYVGTKENWTFDEMLEKWNMMPEGSTFNGKCTREYVYMCILRENITSFVDTQNKTVLFDSPEFLRYLEFINSFPAPLGYKEDISSGVTFVFPVTILNFQEYHSLLRNQNNDDVTLVGYPNKDRNGAFIISEDMRYSISSSSPPEVQKGAWEFLKHFAEYEYQYEYSENAFPVNNKAFEQRGIEAVINSQDTVLSIQGVEFEVSAFTNQEYQRFLDFIPTINRKLCSSDYDMNKIINEELFDMFYDESTPEEAAEFIQNRMSILVSERY